MTISRLSSQSINEQEQEFKKEKKKIFSKLEDDLFFLFCFHFLKVCFQRNMHYFKHILELNT